MKIEEAVIRSQSFQSSVGQWMGFALGLVGLGVSGFCICTGHDAAGAMLGGATLVSLVSVFVAGKSEIIRSLLEKRSHAAGSEGSESDTAKLNRQLAVKKGGSKSLPDEASRAVLH